MLTYFVLHPRLYLSCSNFLVFLPLLSNFCLHMLLEVVSLRCDKVLLSIKVSTFFGAVKELESIVRSIISMLSSPNDEFPANVEAAMMTILPLCYLFFIEHLFKMFVFFFWV
ncbi:uncharacterized protein LOC111894905 [Lactuca sativa]|uniref:uncharacterized protein LOC111894905 n=1 Tax=Lactuca sativa TaxID=4236 RepID=UPI001C68889C|nr:uncharacterized protein LOC111894905 [Lactuca sativa]